MAHQWYFDVISPYAYLQFRQLQAEQLLDELEPTPVLFAGLLNHFGQLGPAEIPAKREFTYRQVLWLARQRGVTLVMPEKHPFNPLPLLRMIIARKCSWQSIEAAFEFVWVHGHIPENTEALSSLLRQQGVASEVLSQPDIKNTLRTHTDSAISHDVFGVPTIRADGISFWGQDATTMYLEYRQDPATFRQHNALGIEHIGTAAER